MDEKCSITVNVKLPYTNLADAEKLIVDLLAPYSPVILSAKREKPLD